MRSGVGVGIRPPNVLGTPKPASSVMMSSTLGAPFGGSTRGGQYGFDWAALRSILPPNFGGGGGSCFPSSVIVAAGEPGTPLICCAVAAVATAIPSTAVNPARQRVLVRSTVSSPCRDDRPRRHDIVPGRPRCPTHGWPVVPAPPPTVLPFRVS